MNLDRMQTLWDNAHNAARRRNLIPGTLGKVTPGGSTVVLATERGPGYVHVRLGSDGALGTAYAYNIAVPPLKGYPVLLLREDNLLVVAGPDYARLPAFLAGEGGQGGGYTVPPHHHREGSGLEYEQQSKLIDVGRVLWESGLTVRIRPFHYRLADGSHAYYPGGTLDLTSYVPGTANRHAWVVVGVDPSDNTAKAAAGTAISTGAALDRADIGGVLDDSYIPLAAIDVANGDTQLNQPSDYVDAREWINTAGGGVGTWLELSDTPAAYTGNAGKFVQVNATPDGLQFADVDWSDLTGVPSSFTPSSHSHGSHTGLGVDDHSQYALLAGRSGGQTLRGGTGSGDDLTLESTSHATKGDVLINPGGGDAAFGTSTVTPNSGYKTVYFGTQGGVQYDNSGFYQFNNNAYWDGSTYRHIANGAAARLLWINGRSIFQYAPSGTAGDALTFQEGIRLQEDGTVGLGVAAPQGRLHAHDGTGGMLFVSKTNINGTAQTIIPNGAGDITLTVIGYHVTAAGATPTGGILGPIGLSGTQNVTVAGNTYQYAVSAAGALTVQRTAGATAGSCALLLLWL